MAEEENKKEIEEKKITPSKAPKAEKKEKVEDTEKKEVKTQAKPKKKLKKKKEEAKKEEPETEKKPKEVEEPEKKVKKEVEKEGEAQAKPKKKLKKKKEEAKKEEPKEEKKLKGVEEPEKKVKKEEEKKKVKDEEEEEEAEEEEEEVEKEEEIEIIEEEEEYKVKIKPKLSDEFKHELKIRREIKKKTPYFRRQEWFRYKKLGTAWRRPRGRHSKMRKHKGYRQNVVSIGYGSPKKARSLHPSGFKEVMVYNTKDLEKIDPKIQAARVGHSVGTRKRIEIEEKAEEKGIRVLNPRR